MLTPQQLATRLVLDWQVLQDMTCDSFTSRAYRSRADLDADRNPIVRIEDAHQARFYRLRFLFRTLHKGGTLAGPIEIGADLGVSGYPIQQPSFWCVSTPHPWSPHFASGSGSVCMGNMWTQARGERLLGHAVIHLARLLNWDEDVRGNRPSYNGWNGAAIDHWQRVYHGKPLNPNLAYPVLPAWLYGQPRTPQFVWK